ncbi:unnamed protein product [Symbiodinium sp. KB8]|nr:unnamed protein product [Symbiodinium sp. KB8]
MICRLAKAEKRLDKVRARPESMLDRLHDHAAALGGKCLASGYKNNKTKVRWQCQHGHTWDAKPDNVLNKKSWCPECARNRRRIPLQRMQDHASAKGGRCLSESKHNRSKTKVLWQCRHGHTWDASPNHVLSRGTWCPACSRKGRVHKKRSLKDLQEHAASLGGRCLATTYKGVRTPVVWQCHKGHTWKASPNSILNQKSWCPVCAGNGPLDLRRLQQHAKHRGGKCLAKKYVNASSKVTWKCKHGHSWRAAPRSVLNSGSWCPDCNRMGLPRLQALAAQLGGKCLAKSYKNRMEKLLWECSAGHRWEANAHSIVNGKTWCPECTASKWRTEAQIRGTLEAIFHPAAFPSCYPSFLQGLQLDGYCPDLLLAFEYQGEQHYDPENYFNFGDPSKFHAQQERDARKVELCRDAGVRLLVIPCFVNDKRTFVLTALLQWFAWSRLALLELPGVQCSSGQSYRKDIECAQHQVSIQCEDSFSSFDIKRRAAKRLPKSADKHYDCNPIVLREGPRKHDELQCAVASEMESRAYLEVEVHGFHDVDSEELLARQGRGNATKGSRKAAAMGEEVGQSSAGLSEHGRPRFYEQTPKLATPLIKQRNRQFENTSLAFHIPRARLGAALTERRGGTAKHFDQGGRVAAGIGGKFGTLMSMGRELGTQRS